jgi:hypothetical protein
MPVSFRDIGADGVARALADLAAVQVHAAHAGVGGEVDEMGAQFLDVAAAQVELLLGQHDDAAALRGFVGQGSELGRVGQIRLPHPVGGQEAVGLAVAQGDGAGLVQQQHVHVARRFHGAAGGGDDVLGHHAAHAGHADGGEQAADGGGDQADQQGGEHRHADRRA